MKKSIFLVLSIFISLFILGSCASGEPIVFNESLPDDEIAVIHYRTGLSIVGYNGITVNWQPNVSLVSAYLEVRIPGGSTEFILDGTWGDVTYRQISFNYNFVKGKEYTLVQNGAVIWIYSGKSTSKNDLLATFNMRRGQIQIN